MGAISPLGLDLESTWRALLLGTSGIDYISHFDASTFPNRIAAEVKGYQHATKPKKVSKFMIRGVQFLADATKMAVGDAKLKTDRVDCKRVGICVGISGNFPDLEVMKYYYDFRNDNYKLDTLRFAREGTINPLAPFHESMNTGSCILSIIYGFKGPNSTVHTACGSSAHSIGTAFRTIQYGDADVMVAGGSDAMITPMGIAAFSILGALSGNNDNPQKASRPFDLKRDGFVLGEGAGVVILEELSHALKRGTHIHCELVGYGSSCDAYRITDSPPDGRGAALAMKAALRDGGLNSTDINYINAHGTSTPQNDKAETNAIKEIFGSHAYAIPISSIKSMIGHTISASGALELIATIFCLRNNQIPPTINYEHPDPNCDLDYVPNESRNVRVDTALSNSFGFGGHNASLIVRKLI
jgi:3-oxoacyl-[acyl-carrier-protein] synthase II